MCMFRYLQKYSPISRNVIFHVDNNFSLSSLPSFCSGIDFAMLHSSPINDIYLAEDVAECMCGYETVYLNAPNHSCPLRFIW